MELSRELFDQIVSKLKGAPCTSDKRQKPRVGLRNRVDLTLLKTSGNPQTAHMSVAVRDLSPGGIGLLHHQKMAPDSLFAIRLLSSSVGTLVAIYKVRHCDSIDADLYRIGAELIKTCDSDADAHAAAADADKAAPTPKAAVAEGKAPATVKSTKTPVPEKAEAKAGAGKTPAKQPVAAVGA
jgi:hypothetical protein